MKRLFILFLLTPLFSIAQKPLPRYDNDTLYTSCGYKIYKGITLHFGKGTLRDGKFRFVNVKSAAYSETLNDNTVVVKKLKNFGLSVLNNAYIDIIGSIKFKDGSKGSIEMHIAFDNAIEEYKNFTPELIVPDEYKPKQKYSVSDEIEKLQKLYKDGIITKGFVQLGLDGRTIISSAYPSFGFGGRNSVGQ